MNTLDLPFQGQTIQPKNGEDAMTALRNDRGDPFVEGVHNDERVETAWVETAVKHAQAYSKLLRRCQNRRTMRLTKLDDAIYLSFRKDFPDVSIELLSDDEIKNETVKPKWREWMMAWKDAFPDNYHFLTLVRLDSHKDYSEENTTVVPRIQFIAIELARCREGFNDDISFDDSFLEP
ncbi:hypothetical protein RCL1_002954 [Eukaryota sp. TZLM3-RCL]